MEICGAIGILLPKNKQRRQMVSGGSNPPCLFRVMIHEEKNKKECRKIMKGKTRMEGTVKWFDVRRGYGFISDEDGVDCYVHFSNINMEGFKKLRSGQKVSFEVEEDDSGRSTAKEVTVIDEQEGAENEK